MRLISATTLLTNLCPTKRIFGLVRQSSLLGLAVSDPYLSFGEPLHEFDMKSLNFRYLKELCAEHDVEGLVLGIPILCKKQKEQEQQELLTLLRNSCNELSLPLCQYESEGMCDASYLKAELKANPLWEALDLGKWK